MPDTETPRSCVKIDAKPAINLDLFYTACAAKDATSDADRARLLGMPRRSVRRYVRGEVAPLLTTAQRIARRLDTSVDELWPAA